MGDADRQRVVDELQAHYVAGRLTSEELGERVTTALAARTFGDLAPLLDDLPLPDGTVAPLGAERAPAAPPALPAWRWLSGPPLAALLLALGLLALLLFALGGPVWHWAPMPFWPVLFWGFFFFGWPRGGRRRHF